MDRNDYISNPCKSSPLSYWRTRNLNIPDYIVTVRDNEYNSYFYKDYRDSVYFRLCHRLEKVMKPSVPDGFELIKPSFDELSEHISLCYDSERLSVEELYDIAKRPVFKSNLHIALLDKGNGRIAATGIGEEDNEVGEGYLDWIQVSNDYRGMGLGKFIVTELLARMRENCSFVTVSGREDNITKPQALYKSCGFNEECLWHILTKNI